MDKHRQHWSLILIAGTLLASTVASAHDIGLSRSTLSADDAGATTLEVVLAAADASVLLPEAVREGLGDKSLDESTLGEPVGPALVTAISAGVSLRAGDRACALTGNVRADPPDGVALTFNSPCRLAWLTEAELAFVERLPSGHRHVATVPSESEGGTHTHILSATDRSLVLEGEEPPSVPTYLVLGVEHILIGFDHLAFLLGLVLVTIRFRSALVMVTAFTVGHSVTLGLAALGYANFEPRYVESFIAFSVMWVGLENLLLKDVKWRPALAGLFGLVHGLGFAGVLGEIGLPMDSELGALALFNVGVEVGQLLVLALVLPALFALRRRTTWFETLGVRALSVGVVALGGYWLIERILG